MDSSDSLYRDDMEGARNSSLALAIDTASTSSDDCKRRNSIKLSSPESPSIGAQLAESPSPASSFILPGFILHPSGTHYMPISVQNTNVSGLLDSPVESGGPPVFHPISIPVHFRRPVI